MPLKKLKKVQKVRKIRKITKLRPAVTNIKGRKLTKGKSKYKEGWHLTWDKKKVYLRSGDEFKYAKKLDKDKIPYEVETISYFYFDTKEQKIKKGFIDFYIPSQNLIIEIKGGHLFDLQNLLDRKIILESKGYKFKVVMNNKEVKLQ